MPDSRQSLFTRLGPLRAVALLALVGCLLAVFETRHNHIWRRGKMKDIQKAKEDNVYHPMMLVDERYAYWGRAVDMMLNDPATRFWLHSKDFTLYAPVVVNHFLHPGHQVMMARESQLDIVNFWLFGNQVNVRHLPPRHYDKAIEASYHYVRFLELASDDGRTTPRLQRSGA